MTKPLFTLMILGLTFQGYTQETDASKLVTLLHQQDMGFRLEMIQQYQPTDSTEKTKDSTALAKTLYTNIEAVYQKQFTEKELKDLYVFYSSPLGTKLIGQQNQLHSDISTVAYNWELEQQGMTPEDLEMPDYNTENGVIEGVGDQISKEEVASKIVEIPLPNIANLDDLKALLRKDPFIIADQNILLALFGKEELDRLFDQLMGEEEAELIETQEKETIKQ